MERTLIVFVFLSYFIAGCSQNPFGPGYSFDLFKNTANWQLAKAVKKENVKEIKRILSSRKININLQDSKYGNTLLLLAIGNDKLNSTKELLEEGADVNNADFEGFKPIHEATMFINLKVNSFEILKLLIKYGANVNDTCLNIKNGDTLNFYVPLMGGSKNLRCGKLLIENGANPYVNRNGNYFIWQIADGPKTDQNIFFAKYLIVDKKMAIPDPISYQLPDKNPLDIYDYLETDNFAYDSKKEKAKQEIEDYLHKIDFPNSQIYHPGATN